MNHQFFNLVCYFLVSFDGASFNVPPEETNRWLEP